MWGKGNFRARALSISGEVNRLEDHYLRAAASLEDVQLEQLIASHWSDVWNFVYILVRRRDAADDLTQETFVRAFRSLSAFRGQSSYRTWLLRIARNVSINYRRSFYFRRIVSSGDLSSGRSGDSAEDEYWHRREWDEIWEQVLRLPAKLREVLVLDAKYGLSMQEISELLHLPEGTVKSRLYRARQRMSVWREGERGDERNDEAGLVLPTRTRSGIECGADGRANEVDRAADPG